MPEIEILLGGYTFNADQTRMGLSTVALIWGQTPTVVDVAHFGRRNMLVDELQNRGFLQTTWAGWSSPMLTGTTPRTPISSPTPKS